MTSHRVSESTAYRVIQKLNDELEARGFLTFKARVISRYFYERYVIFTNATAWRANDERHYTDPLQRGAICGADGREKETRLRKRRRAHYVSGQLVAENSATKYLTEIWQLKIQRSE